MKLWKVPLLVVVTLAVTLVAAWRAYRPGLEEAARRLAEDELRTLYGVSAGLSQVQVGLMPPVVTVRDLYVGEKGALARLDHLRFRLFPLRSLARLGVVGEITAGSLWLDLPGLDALPPGAEQPSTEQSLPPLWVDRIRLDELTTRLADGGKNIDLTGRHVLGGLEARDAEGYLHLHLNGRDLDLRQGEAALALKEVRIALEDRGNGVVLRDLEIRSDGLVVSATTPDTGRGRLHAEGELHRLAFIDEQLQPLHGQYELRADFDGLVFETPAVGSIDFTDLAVDGILFGAAKGEFTTRDDRIELTSFTARPGGGQLEADGTLLFAGRQPATLRTRWTDVHLATPLAGADDHLSSDGRLVLAADLRPFAAHVNANGRLSISGSELPIDWSTTVSREISATQARLRLEHGSENRAELDVAVEDDGSLNGDLAASLADLAFLHPWIDRRELAAVDGSLTVSGRVGGTIIRPTFDGQANASSIRVFGEEIGHLEGAVAVDRERAVSDGIDVSWPGGALRASGTLGLEDPAANDWQLRIHALPIDTARRLTSQIFELELPISDGTLDANLSVHGDWSRPVVKGQIGADRFRVLGEPFDSLRVDLHSATPGWGFDVRLARGASERLSADVLVGPGAAIDVTVESSPWSIAHLGNEGEAGLSGSVAVRGRVTGPIAALDGSIAIDGRQLSWNGHSIGDGNAMGESTGGDWRLSGSLMNGAVGFNGSFRKPPRGRFLVHLRWDDAELRDLLGGDRALRLVSSGTLDLSGHTDDPLDLAGHGVIASLVLAGKTLRASAVEPIRVRGEGGRFTIDPFTVEGKGINLHSSGRFGLDGSLRLVVEGNGKLQLLELLGEPVRSARGRFGIDARAERDPGGTFALVGEASISAAAFDFGFPVGPQRTSGRISFVGSELRIEELAGRIGGGTFSIGGTVDVERGPDLTWEFDDVSTGILPPVEDEMSGAGTVRGSWEDLTVAGDLQIQRMLYDRRISLTNFIPSFGRVFEDAPPSAESSAVTIRLDLNLTAPGEIYIDNNFARIEAKADLHVGGSVDHVRLSGPVELLEGQVFFRGRTFEVTTGLIEFRPRLGVNPFLNIVAESEIETDEETYTVTIRVEGPLDDYRANISADDGSLTQTDVASLIGFGKTAAQMQAEGRGVSLTDLVALAPGAYTERAQREVANILYLDRVEFEPTFSRTTGDFEPQLTLGKNITEDLAATFGSTFGVEGRQTVSLDYALTRGISLFGSWESQTTRQAAAFAGGILMHRPFRNLPGLSLLGQRGAEELDER